MNYLDTLSSFAAGLRFPALPEAVRAHTGWILADTVAAIAAGSAEPELQALAALLTREQAGLRLAPVWKRYVAGFSCPPGP